MAGKDPSDEAPDEEPLESFEGDPADHLGDEAEPGKGRFARLTQRLMNSGEDARYLLGTVLDSSDKAKTEMVRLMAREVRHYLEALKLKEDLADFATSHSLEVKASFSLKPIADAMHDDESDGEQQEGRDPKARRADETGDDDDEG